MSLKRSIKNICNNNVEGDVSLTFYICVAFGIRYLAFVMATISWILPSQMAEKRRIKLCECRTFDPIWFLQIQLSQFAGNSARKGSIKVM